jgi:hypothetical protein
MKVFVALTVAQEVDGKNVLIRFDKASKSKPVIDQFLLDNKNSWVEKIKVSDVDVSFACERHPHELEVEE